MTSLLLLAAVSFGQQSVEKIPLQHVPADTVFKAIQGKVTGIDRIIYDPTDNSLIVQGSKDAIALLRVLVRQIDQASRTQTISLKNVSAQYLLEMLTSSGRFKDESNQQGILPPGVRLSVDSLTNSIVATGADAAIRETELLIEQIDIKAAPVDVDVRATMPQIGRTFSTSGTVANGSSLEYKDDRTDTKLKVTARIQGDGTIFIAVTGGTLGSTTKAFARLKSGQTAYVRFSPTEDNGQPVMSVMVATDVKNEDILTSNKVEASGVTMDVDRDSIRAPKQAELRLLIKVTLPAQ